MRALILTVLLLVCGVCLIPATGWSQEEYTVKPDSGQGSAPTELTEADRELLLKLKGLAAGGFAVRADRPGDEEAAQASKDNAGLVQDIEALDKLLAKASKINSPEMSRELLGLMSASHSSVRITTLHWLVRRSDVVIEALAGGLRDDEDLVRSVAAQFLLDRGVSEDAVAELKVLAKEKTDGLEYKLRNTLVRE